MTHIPKLPRVDLTMSNHSVTSAQFREAADHNMRLAYEAEARGKLATARIMLEQAIDCYKIAAEHMLKHVDYINQRVKECNEKSSDAEPASVQG